MDEQLRIILIILISVTIFGIITFIFVRNYLKMKIDNMVEQEKKDKKLK